MLADRFKTTRPTGASFVCAYTIDASLSEKDKKRIATTLSHDTVDTLSWTKVLSPKRFAYAIEVGFLPGITDNVGHTVEGMVEDALSRKLKEGEAVYSSFFLFLSGPLLSRPVVERMALEIHNPLIERATLFSFSEWRGGRIPCVVPKVVLPPPQQVQSVSLHVPDADLATLGKEGIANEDGSRRGPLSLSLAELRAIRAHFDREGRDPTDIELESLAQTWSEHCKHTIFGDPLDEIRDGIYRHYIKRATERIRAKKGKKDFCVSVFKDNSGGIIFNDEYLVTHKVETHNSPSALDPYGGAITGICGVNRDALGFGLGAKPIANVYGFCVGSPREKRILYRDKTCTTPLLSPRRILEGVVKGVNAGGNQSGIPTPLGFVYTDESYRGKPLVFAGTVGLLPRKQNGRELHKKKARPGDYIVMFGGRVGLDGIHGATFSSEALSVGSPATAVQIGDPITQKRFMDAVIRDLRDAGLYTSITDNGAGGLSCSVAEMARESGGCLVALDTVPLKYPGLSPWEIWISESQERMTISVPKKHWTRVKRLLDKHDVEATRIGTFTRSGSCVVQYKKKTILSLPLSFLHDGRPVVHQKSKKPIHTKRYASVKQLPLKKAMLALLAHPNIGSRAFTADQYDHEVQGTSVTKPLQGRGRVDADATVIRPLLGDPRGLVLSQGYCPSYARLDAYHMASGAIDTAVRNAVCAGAPLNHLAILDNFCWSSGHHPERLYELKEAARACFDTAVAYGTPFISGKDSMFNDFRGYDARGNATHIAAVPTLLISAISVMEDATKAMTLNLAGEGDVLFLLGKTREEFGGSEYTQIAYPRNSSMYGRVPTVTTKENLKTYRVVEQAITKQFVSAAIGLSRGGLSVAVSKMVIAGQRGATLSLTGNPHTMLFSESQGRVLLSVPKEKVRAFTRAVRGVTFQKIGEVRGGTELAIRFSSGTAIRIPLSKLTSTYRAPFKNFEVSV